MGLTLKRVSKKFQKKCVIHNLDLHIEHGIVALLGPNGSGKTTLIRMIVGNIKPSDGEILWYGKDISENYDAYASILGYVPQHTGLYPEFHIQEFLEYMGLLKGLKKDFVKIKIDTLLKELHLEDKRKKKIKTLSGGMLRRVSIAQALLNEPKILILDEPTAGLDPKERKTLRNIIANMANNCLVLYSTHIVSDIEAIANEVVLIKEGKVLVKGSIQELNDEIAHKVFEYDVNTSDVKGIEENHTLINYIQKGDISSIRVLADTKPVEYAKEVTPTLNDLYLYYFDKEDRLC